MASQREICVCAMERGPSNPESDGAHAASLVDDQNAAVHEYFPFPVALRSPDVHGIARGIAQQWRLIFAHARSRTQRFASINHFYVRSHADKHPGIPVAATNVSAYSSGFLALDKQCYSSFLFSAHPCMAGISHILY